MILEPKGVNMKFHPSCFRCDACNAEISQSFKKRLEWILCQNCGVKSNKDVFGADGKNVKWSTRAKEEAAMKKKDEEKKSAGGRDAAPPTEESASVPAPAKILEVKFCGDCGKKRDPPDSKFCGDCGTKF